MPYFLKWPANVGNTAGLNNKCLCQISGITGSLATVRYTLAESMPAFISGTPRYIFDARRQVGTTSGAADVGYLLQNSNGLFTTDGTTGWKINGVSVTAAQLFGSIAADSVCEFDVGRAVSGGCIAFGARFNDTEHNYGLAVKNITIIDGAGTHTIDMSASNGSTNTFTSTDGVLTLALFNFPANNSHWVPYGNVSVTQDVVVPASKQQDKAVVVTIGTTQVLTVPAAKHQDVAATVAIGTNQVLTVTGSKQQDTATVVTIGTTQVLTVAGSKQQDKAAAVNVGTTQVLTVPAAKQQDTATALTIGTNQVLAVPATKQQDVAAAVSVAQVAPGSQPITVPAAKQQDVAGVVTVGTSQLITAAGTKQQDSASAISIGQSQIVSVAAIKQQDKAATVTVGTIQTLAVQPVTQTDTAARVAVGTTQLVDVPSAQQIDRAAAITLMQQPPITQTIDVRTLRIELTTPRFGVARNTPVYTAQLTTPRYTVARA